MGDLETDSAIASSGEGYEGILSPHWSFLAPNGGYLATMCLRAASEGLGPRTPLSISCSFLAAGTNGEPAQLKRSILKAGKRADCVAIDMFQSGRQLVHSVIWQAPLGSNGTTAPPEHHVARMPAVPSINDIASTDKSARIRTSVPFWQNFEEKLVTDSASREVNPTWTGWYRLVPRSRFASPILNAARALIVLDAFAFYALLMGQPEKFVPATTMQTDILFCGSTEANETDWILVDIQAPRAAGGFLWAHGTVWSEAGVLLAMGNTKMTIVGEMQERPNRVL